MSAPMRRMFGRIAERYEIANSFMSLFQDGGWRREGIRKLSVQPADLILMPAPAPVISHVKSSASTQLQRLLLLT